MEELRGLNLSQLLAVESENNPAQQPQSTAGAGEFSKGLANAWQGVKSNIRGAGAMVQDLYDPAAAAETYRSAQEDMDRVQRANSMKVNNFTDINSVGDAADWTAGSLGQAIPSIGTALVSGLAARTGLAGVARTARGFGKPGLADALSHKTTNMIAGMGAATMPMESGEQAMNLQADPEAVKNTTALQRAGISLGKGAVNSALEILPEAKAFGVIGKHAIEKGAAGIGKAALKEAGTGILSEGVTEGAQNVVGDIAQGMANPDHNIDWKGALNAGAAGAVGGGGMGLVGGTFQGVKGQFGQPKSEDGAEQKTGLQNMVVDGIAAAERTAGKLYKKGTDALAAKDARMHFDDIVHSEQYNQLLDESGSAVGGQAGVEADAAHTDSLLKFATEMTNGVGDHLKGNLRESMQGASMDFRMAVQQAKSPAEVHAAKSVYVDTLKQLRRDKKYSEFSEIVNPATKSSEMGEKAHAAAVDASIDVIKSNEAAVPKHVRDAAMDVVADNFPTIFDPSLTPAHDMNTATLKEALYKLAVGGFTIGKSHNVPSVFTNAFGDQAADVIAKTAHILSRQGLISSTAASKGMAIAREMQGKKVADATNAEHVASLLSPVGAKHFAKTSPRGVVQELAQLHGIKTPKEFDEHLTLMFGADADKARASLGSVIEGYKPQTLGGKLLHESDADHAPTWQEWRAAHDEDLDNPDTLNSEAAQDIGTNTMNVNTLQDKVTFDPYTYYRDKSKLGEMLESYRKEGYVATAISPKEWADAEFADKPHLLEQAYDYIREVDPDNKKVMIRLERRAAEGMDISGHEFDSLNTKTSDRKTSANIWAVPTGDNFKGTADDGILWFARKVDGEDRPFAVRVNTIISRMQHSANDDGEGSTGTQRRYDLLMRGISSMFAASKGEQYDEATATATGGDTVLIPKVWYKTNTLGKLKLHEITDNKLPDDLKLGVGATYGDLREATKAKDAKALADKETFAKESTELLANGLTKTEAAKLIAERRDSGYDDIGTVIEDADGSYSVYGRENSQGKMRIATDGDGEELKFDSRAAAETELGERLKEELGRDYKSAKEKATTEQYAKEQVVRLSATTWAILEPSNSTSKDTVVRRVVQTDKDKAIFKSAKAAEAWLAGKGNPKAWEVEQLSTKNGGWWGVTAPSITRDVIAERKARIKDGAKLAADRGVSEVDEMAEKASAAADEVERTYDAVHDNEKIVGAVAPRVLPSKIDRRTIEHLRKGVPAMMSVISSADTKTRALITTSLNNIASAATSGDNVAPAMQGLEKGMAVAIQKRAVKVLAGIKEADGSDTTAEAIDAAETKRAEREASTGRKTAAATKDHISPERSVELEGFLRDEQAKSIDAFIKRIQQSQSITDVDKKSAVADLNKVRSADHKTAGAVYSRVSGELFKSGKNSEQSEGAKGATQEEIDALVTEHIKVVGSKLQSLDVSDGLLKDGRKISGEWTEKLIRVSRFSADALGTLRHEHIHTLFSWLTENGSEATLSALNNLGKNPIILGKLQGLLEGHPNAIKQLSNPEEAAAFAYQFWNARNPDGSRMLELAPKTESFLRRVGKFVARIFSASDEHLATLKDAEAVFEAMSQGEFADKNDAAMAAINSKLAEAKAVRERAGVYEKHFIGNKMLQKAVFSNYTTLHDTKIPALMKLADQFWVAHGKRVESGSPDLMTAKKQQANKFNGTFGKIYDELKKNTDKALLKSRLEAANKHLTGETEINDIHDPVVKKYVEQVRSLLGAVHTYAVDAKVSRLDEQGHWKIINKINNGKYFPRAYDMDYLHGHNAEFRELLHTHHEAELQKLVLKAEQERATGNYGDEHSASRSVDSGTPITTDNIVDAIISKLTANGGIEGKDNSGEVTTQIGVTPYAAAVNKRSLQWLDASKFTDFLSKDSVRSVTSYIHQMVGRAETTRMFGNGSEQIKQAMDKAYVTALLGTDAQYDKFFKDAHAISSDLMEKYGFSETVAAHHASFIAHIDGMNKAELTADKAARKVRMTAVEKSIGMLNRSKSADIEDLERLDHQLSVMAAEQEAIDAQLAKPADAAKNAPTTVRAMAEAAFKGTDAERTAAIEAANAKLEVPMQAVQAMEGTLGREIDNTMRNLMQGVMAYENIRLLPLVLFSSMADPAGVVIRGGTMKDVLNTFTAGIQWVVRGWTGKPLEMDDATQRALYMGLVDAGSQMNAVSETYGSAYGGSSWIRKLNDNFFRINGLEAWNKAMRIQAGGVAESFIMRHLTEPNKHSTRLLADIGLTGSKADYMATEDKGNGLVKAGTLDITNPVVQQAVMRWVDGAIMNPNAAMRPILASDQHYAILYQYTMFTYAFQNTILTHLMNEMEHGNLTPLMTAVATLVPMMVGADLIKAMITSGGDEPFWAKSLSGILGHGFSRSGLPGVAGMWTSRMPFIGEGHIASALGPAVDQAVTLSMTPFDPELSTSRELLSALPAGNALRHFGAAPSVKHEGGGGNGLSNTIGVLDDIIPIWMQTAGKNFATGARAAASIPV